MPTVNKNLQKLSKDDVLKISEEYLMGWHDLYPKYGFRIKGFNHKREEFGLMPLDKDMSFEYRLDYIRKHYDNDTILSSITDYMNNNHMDDARWTGIEIFDCRFGREWAKFMKELVGSSEYRKLSEQARVSKLTCTQEQLYGGVGLAGADTFQKASTTIQSKYNCDNVMHDVSVKKKVATTNLSKYGSISPFGCSSVQSKSMKSRSNVIQNAILAYKKTGVIDRSIFKQSTAEYTVFLKLVSKFGVDDVVYQYGFHPYDARYPFACDFYIKSLDLFIELNGYYGHGGHWYDCNNHDDVLRATHWLNSGKSRNLKSYRIWTEDDVDRRHIASQNKLKYLVFWDGSSKRVDGKLVPNLSDFYMWFYDYKCDYDSFVKEYPGNTY